MIDYRPFRNNDPPSLCEIWRNHAPLRAFFRPLTPPILESMVLSKPFFDRDGLIVAVENGRLIGFAHAGFAPNQKGDGLDTSVGATCMLMVSHPRQRHDVARELLARSEAYLRQRGAQQIHGGSTHAIAPFYQGLYGGATTSGVMATDTETRNLFSEAGYVESGRNVVLQRPLAGFRPLVDRQQMQLKRSLLVEPLPDPPAATWWEACNVGFNDRYCFSVRPRTGAPTKSTVTFWDIEPLASSWGVHAAGLTNLQLDEPEDRETLTLFLLGESLRQMAAEGMTLAEAHTVGPKDPLHAILERLGFREVEQTIELIKEDLRT